jgi:pyruvate formate lyase activating enzyme
VAGVSPDIRGVCGLHGDYKMTSARHDARDASEREIVRRSGLRFVYAGNRPGSVGGLEDTRCPTCGDSLIERFAYHVRAYRLTADGACPKCGTSIPGRWASRFDGQVTARPFRPERFRL